MARKDALKNDNWVRYWQKRMDKVGESDTEDALSFMRRWNMSASDKDQIERIGLLEKWEKGKRRKRETISNTTDDLRTFKMNTVEKY